MRSQESRDFHWQEIEELLREKPELLPVYSEEMGRVQARKYRKRLKEEKSRPYIPSEGQIAQNVLAS